MEILSDYNTIYTEYMRFELYLNLVLYAVFLIGTFITFFQGRTSWDKTREAWDNEKGLMFYMLSMIFGLLTLLAFSAIVHIIVAPEVYFLKQVFGGSL